MNLLYFLAFTFHWKRLLHPVVITGIVIMLAGFVFNFCSKYIAGAIAKKRVKKGEEPNTEMLEMTFRFLAIGITLAGMLTAIMSINWAD